MLTIDKFVARVTANGDLAFKGLTSDWWRRVLLRDVCVYCNDEPTGLDHIKPRASNKFLRNQKQADVKQRQWMNGIENRAPACQRCDGHKSDQSLLLFLMRVRCEGLPTQTEAQLHRRLRLAKVQRRLKWRHRD